MPDGVDVPDPSASGQDYRPAHDSASPTSLPVSDLVERESDAAADRDGHQGAADPTPERDSKGPEPHKWWTLVAVCLGTFMLLLDVTIVNVALPDIQSALHSSFSDLQWVVDAYALTLASLLLTAGSLADLFGRRLLRHRVGGVHCGVTVVRDRAEHPAAPTLPCGAGNRRRGDVRGVPGAARRCLSRS
jgi:hypothetical protein